METIETSTEKVNVFTYALPFIQTFLANRGLTEYHIHVKPPPLFNRAFFENTQKEFVDAVYDYISAKYNKDIFYQGKAHDEVFGEYIFLHFKTEVAEGIIKRVVDDISKHYDEEWIKHRIPSLFALTRHNLEEAPFFANALSHFQEENGFEATQHIIDIYYNHLSSL
jgi:hypothetical protein